MKPTRTKTLALELDGAPASTTLLSYPADQAHAALLLAHGAGAPQTHPWMVAISEAIARLGVAVYTFNFLYTEAGRRLPDKNPLLEATFRAVIREVRAEVETPLFIGGKSMGGRIATQVAARGEPGLSGLVLLGYPLHPPGKPLQLRWTHMPKVTLPMLFIQGERDAFGPVAELAPRALALHSRARILAIEGGDHSLATPKRSGVTLEQTFSRAAGEIARFTRDTI
jgi:predicted alpha/beta-hydrolase family hydrolase